MKKEKNGLLFNLLLITIFFNIWFPKAGIKFSGIPLTVGNVFFAITFILWVITKLKKIKINKIGIFLFFSILYFIFKYIIISTSDNILNYFTYIIPLIVYPFMFYLMLDMVNSEYRVKKVIKIIIFGFFFCCFYSLIQFIVGIGNCDIPGLTVNLTDYQVMGPAWYMAKSNGLTEDNAKIVSTYQNGNLFGVNMILIYPLIYNYFKSKNKTRNLMVSLILFIACVFLSLSRTCWLGVILFIFFGIIMDNEKTKSSFARKVFIILLCIVSMVFVFCNMPSVSNRFLDTDASDWISMSGRTEGIITLLHSMIDESNFLAWLIGPCGIIDYRGLSYEVLPAALLAQTGIIGLVFIYLLFFKIVNDLKNKNIICDSIRLSLIIWLIIGCIECGYWLPPTALNIFILVGLGYAINKLKLKELRV